MARDARCGISEAVHVRPAASRVELQQAYHLVYVSYLQRGYIDHNPSEMRFTPYNLLPRSATFVSMLADRVIATVSVVPDSPCGLPMDQIYRPELDRLRRKGRKLAEVTMLADRRREMSRTLPMLLLLMKYVFDYASLLLEANDLCITINPRHESYYRRGLLFQDLGPLRRYPSVRENPALAKRLDLDHVREQCEGNEELLAQFFRDRVPLEELRSSYVPTSDDIRYFLLDRSRMLAGLSPDMVECLRSAYPSAPWDQWCAQVTQTD